MEKVKSVLNVIVAAVQSYPEGALIVWGVSLRRRNRPDGRLT